MLSGSQLEVSESILHVKNSKSSAVAIVFAPADCDDDRSKVAMLPLQQVSKAALLPPQSGAEHIAVMNLDERHSVSTRGDKLLGQV